jgi:hypothetical protein
VVERHDVERVADRDVERVVLAPQRQHARLAGEVLGDQAHRG